MASTKDIGVASRKVVWGKASGLEMVRQYLDVARSLHPPLEGEGRTRPKEAAGWGDSLSTRTLFETRDRHPTPSRIRFAHTSRPPSRGGLLKNYAEAVVTP